MKNFYEVFGVSLALLLGACASPPTNVAPPRAVDPDQNVPTYQAEQGAVTPATSADVTTAAGAAVVDNALPGSTSAEQPLPKYAIVGTCTIVSSDGSKSPCADVSLTLNLMDGTPYAHQRTDVHGNFVFEVEKDGRYVFDKSSALYSMEIKPKRRAFRAGSHVRVKLSPKGAN